MDAICWEKLGSLRRLVMTLQKFFFMKKLDNYNYNPWLQKCKWYTRQDENHERKTVTTLMKYRCRRKNRNRCKVIIIPCKSTPFSTWKNKGIHFLYLSLEGISTLNHDIFICVYRATSAIVRNRHCFGLWWLSVIYCCHLCPFISLHLKFKIRNALVISRFYAKLTDLHYELPTTTKYVI